MRSLLLLPAAVLCFTGAVRAADDWHYATKADARAGRRTPGRAVPTPPPLDPDAGGENCGTATAIPAPLPFTDSDDTTGNASDVGLLPDGCSNYQIVDGPDLVYSFTVGAGNSVAFTVTPDERHLRSRDLRARHVRRRRHLRRGRRRLRPAREPPASRRAAWTAPPTRICPRSPTPSAPTRSSSTRSTPRAPPAAPRAASSAAPGPYTLSVTGSLPVHLQRFEVE